MPRLLYWIALGCGLGFLGLVGLCPWLVNLPRNRLEQILWLFAHDPVVRKTSIAAGLGLIATARLFFRQGVFPEREQILDDAPLEEQARLVSRQHPVRRLH